MARRLDKVLYPNIPGYFTRLAIFLTSPGK